MDPIVMETVAVVPMIQETIGIMLKTTETHQDLIRRLAERDNQLADVIAELDRVVANLLRIHREELETQYNEIRTLKADMASLEQRLGV